MDVELLISSVQGIPAIWDASHPKHFDRGYINEQWSVIADAVKVNADAARKKFKILKDHFRLELKKVLQGKFGDPGIPLEDYTSKWPYFKMLFFLKDQILGRRTTGNLTEIVLKQSLTQEDSEEPHDLLINTPSSQADPNLKSNVQSQIYHYDEYESAALEQRSVKKQKTKQNVHETFLSLEKEKLEILKKDEISGQDDKKQFLLSLLPSMSKLTPENESLFRIKVQELMHNLLFPKPQQNENLHDY